MESLEGFVVRAVDLGYGNVKFTMSHDDAFGSIVCDLFPSRSPLASDKGLSAGILRSRNTATLRINQTEYEVGKEVAKAQGANDSTAVLDKKFCLSDAHMARLRGALHYMSTPDSKGHNNLPGKTIHLLVVGLPVNTYFEKGIREELQKALIGEHPLEGDNAVTVERVIVLPQPMGAFFDYSFEKGLFDEMKEQNTLVIDPGYNTFDWLFSEGVVPNTARSDSTVRGTNYVLRAMADAMKKEEHWDTQPETLVRMLDDHFRTGRPFIVYGRPVEVSQYLPAGRGIINEAVSAMINKVGDGADIQYIILAGGGAQLYQGVIAERFPRHNILVMDTPVFANVRGFQLAGERQILSLLRSRRKSANSSASLASA